MSPKIFRKSIQDRVYFSDMHTGAKVSLVIVNFNIPGKLKQNLCR